MCQKNSQSGMPFWVMTAERLDSQESPCECCHPQRAWDQGVWTCQKTDAQWFVVDEEPRSDSPHTGDMCCGNCPQHPLVDADYIRYAYAPMKGLTWGDLALEEVAAAAAVETWEERQARLNREAAQEAANALNAASIKCQVYADKVKFMTRIGLRKGQEVQKKSQPCKWVVGEFKGDECWAHEYTDPKTGRRERPRTCCRVHPGEPGWHDEWLTNPRWVAPGAGRDMRCLAVRAHKPIAVRA